MKYSKPLTYFVCLLATGSAFAAGEAAKPAAPAKPAAISAAPAAPVLRISVIDGKANPNHKKEIQRRPGKKISFAADIFVMENGKLVSQKANPQDFLWEINSYSNFKCEAARPTAHCKDAGIEVTKDGIKLDLDSGMFDSMGFEDGIPAERTKLALKVTYAKDKKLSDKIVIADLSQIETEAEAAKATKDLEESNNSGVGGFFNSLLGVTFTATSSDSEPVSSPGHSDDCSPYDSTPSCPFARRDEERRNWRRLEETDPATAQRLHEAQRSTFEATHPRDNDWQNRDNRNFGQRPDWQNRGHDETHVNRDNGNLPASATSDAGSKSFRNR